MTVRTETFFSRFDQDKHGKPIPIYRMTKRYLSKKERLEEKAQREATLAKFKKVVTA